MCKEKKSLTNYVGHDLFGYEYNLKYPPNKKLFGSAFGGYATPNQETFFYDFCILQYGVAFYYNETLYEAEFTDDGPIVTNRMTKEVQGPFDDAMQLLELTCIEGRMMITIIDELQDVVLH